MEENGCCAAKDYLRDYYSILDTMIYGMTHAMQTDSISYNFIMQMMRIISAEEKMSERLLDCSSYLPLRCAVKKMNDVIKKEASELEALKRLCLREHKSASDLLEYDAGFRRICEVMFREMKCADVTERINCDFICEIIPCCRGAAAICENALDAGVSSCLVPIIKELIRMFGDEIECFSEIRCMLGCM